MGIECDTLMVVVLLNNTFLIVQVVKKKERNEMKTQMDAVEEVFGGVGVASKVWLQLTWPFYHDKIALNIDISSKTIDSRQLEIFDVFLIQTNSSSNGNAHQCVCVCTLCSVRAIKMLAMFGYANGLKIEQRHTNMVRYL